MILVDLEKLELGYQFLVEIITILISLISGIVIGHIMKIKVFGENEKYFVDEEYFEEIGQEEENELKVKIPQNIKLSVSPRSNK